MLAAALLAACPSLLWGGAVITVINSDPSGSGLNDATPATPVGGNPGTTLGQQRFNAAQRAADIWAGILDSPVPIRIQVRFSALTCNATSAVLANTGATQLVTDFTGNPGFPGAQFSNTWYPIALANRRAGRDLLSGDDIQTRINSALGQTGCGFDWYYGFDDQHGDKIDLVTTLLHEYAHGYGFATAVDPSTGQEFQSRPDIFERNILDVSTGKLWPEMSVAERAISATNTEKVAWVGAATTATAPAQLHGTPELRVTAPAAVAGNYAIGLADFGPVLTEAGLSGTLVAALDPADAAGPTTFDACSPITNPSSIAGKIALVDRGMCTFVIKTLNAQAAGAIGVVVADNVDGSPPAGLGGSDPTITIPAVRITKADGATLRASAGVTIQLFLDDSLLAGTDGSNHVLLFAPNPIQGGSSISHWDTTVVPNLLMEPGISFDLTHGVDLTLPALRDIGWYRGLRRARSAHAGSPHPHHQGRAAETLTSPLPAHLEAIFSIVAHSESVTGMTERREMRTSGMEARAFTALISARVTGRGSFLTGATSTAASLPVLSFGSA